MTKQGQDNICSLLFLPDCTFHPSPPPSSAGPRPPPSRPSSSPPLPSLSTTPISCLFFLSLPRLRQPHSGREASASHGREDEEGEAGDRYQQADPPAVYPPPPPPRLPPSLESRPPALEVAGESPAPSPSSQASDSRSVPLLTSAPSTSSFLLTQIPQSPLFLHPSLISHLSSTLCNFSTCSPLHFY